MDDLLYFLLIIGWLAFSFYQQSVKKKRKQEAMEAARRQEMVEDQQGTMGEPMMQEEQPDRRRNFVEDLERMLGGEAQSLEEIPEYEAQSLETIPEPAQMTEIDENEEINIYQKYYDTRLAPVSEMQGKTEKMEDRRLRLQKEMEQQLQLVEIAEEPVSGTSHFDLRKAIIYSEILNRKYS